MIGDFIVISWSSSEAIFLSSSDGTIKFSGAVWAGVGLEERVWIGENGG